MEAEIQSHEAIRQITEVLVIPSHPKRTESDLFKQSKEQLKKNGHYQCWVGQNCEGDLEAHHFGMEWCLEPDCDFDKLKEFLIEHDIYGYSKVMKNIPLISVDDIRNMLVLCKKHHTASQTGIHESTFPIWLSQKISKTGFDPVEKLNQLKNKKGGDING